jgi:predicted transcriptional regulator
MLHFLNESKINLIKVIRSSPDSITNIAKKAHRSREAVSRDIREMSKFGLIKISKAINPGHGQHKIIELVANKLRLEAII